MIKYTSFRGASLPPAAAAPSSSSQTTAPWGALSPYLQKGYEMAANAYAQGPAQYTPFSQAATLTPDQLAQVNGVNQYVNAPGTQKMLNNQSNAVQNLMTGANNPYNQVTNITNPALAGYLSNNNLNDPSGGINRFMYQNISDPALQNAISSGIGQADAALGGGKDILQNHFGFGQNMAQNLANIGKSDVVNQAYGDAYNQQNAQRLAAIQLANNINNQKAGINASLLTNAGDWKNNAANLGYANYANAMQAPLTLLDQLNQMGGVKQTQAQQQLNDATNRWNFNQQAPYEALAKYAALINPSPSWGNVYTSNNNTVQGPGTNWPALLTGAGTSAAGLAASTANK